MTFDPTRESTFEPQTSTAFSSLPQQSQYIPRLAPRDLGEQDSVLSSYLPQDQPSVPKGDYSQVGKFNLGLNLPAPWVSPIRPEALDPRTPAPALGPQAPGIFEGIFRGVEQLPGQFLPGYINDHVNNLFGLVGSVPDTVLRQFGTIKELPGGGDVEQAFSIMPETAEKQRYEQAILASPTNRLHFMAQYLREFEKDWASETGRNRLLSGFDLPSESLAEQLSRVVGGLLGTSNLTSRRTYVGSPARDVRGTVLDAPVGSLPEDLEYLRTRYLASDQTEQDYNDLLDDIAGSRWAWSNDPGLVGSAASLFSDVLTDPLTYLSFGIGKAAAVVGRGVVGIRAMKAVSLGDRLAPEVMAGIRSTLPKGADNLAIMDRLRQVRPDIVDQATDALTRSQKASLQLEPMIRKAADISNRAMDPLSWFGVDRVGKGLTAVLANKALDGQVNAMGAGRLLSYTRAAIRNRGTDDRLAAALGTANAYTANSVMAESLAREVTESIGPELGDATPMEVIAARREVRDLIDEIEDHYRRVEYQPGIAPGRSGAEAVAARLEQDKEFARKVYQDLTGAGDDEAAAWVEKHISTRSGEKHISNMHMLHFSDSINTMDAARQESIRQLEVALRGVAEGSEEATAIAERIDRRQRYTLIGARELTDDRARQLLVLANEGKAADIRAAIAQYQQLSANFRGKRLADDVLLARARRVLEDMLENDTLVKTVPDASLDGPLMTWRQREHARYGDEYSYQVGIAPENPWRPTFDEDGVAIAVNPWVPAVPATGRAKMPTTMDRVRLGLFSPIRGNRILFEAKSRFVRGAVEKGLNPGEAESLYHAIRKAADEQRVGTRGLRPDQLWQISGSIDLPPFVRAKLPDRELAMLVARSFEGELSTVGVTSKLSGILKTRMSNRMLNAGYIAEAMYPMIRYYGSPIFNAQEFAEGPLLNIFRGHKPGLGRWSEKDKAILRVLDKLNSHERYADQTEHIFLVAAAARVVREKMGEGTRVEQAVGRIDAAKGAFAGRGLASIKEQNYIRQAGHEAAEAFREAIEQVAPGEYARMQVAYDTVDPLDIMLRYFNEKGITREENPRWNVFMMDISKPADMGMEANLLLGDHARAMGFESTADLRAAIRTGDFPRSRFDDAYDSLGIDPMYKERLWAVLNNPSRPELRESWIDDLVTSGVSRGTAERQVKEAMQTFQAATKAMGLKLDDWLPNRFSDWKQAQAWLDRLGEAQAALAAGDHGPALRLFAEDIQLSGRKRIAEARGIEGWDDSTVDWLRERFDAFAADPEAVADNPTMHHIFTSYARFVRDALDAPEGPAGRIEQVLNRASVDDLYRELGVDPDGPRPAVRAAADGTPELIETASLFGSGKKLDEVELAPGGAGYIVSKKPPEYLYRAISEEEWTKAKAQGYLQSDGRMNLSADEGTVVSLEPSTFYLPGRLASSAPGDHPGRIIRIKYDPAEKWRLDADGYVKTSERIPIERVDKDVSLVTRRRSGADYDTVRVTDRPPLPPFKDVATRNADVPSAMFDADEHRVWEAARHALLRYEDQAQKTHFYARGRNWVERSLNHPYLGLYPLSYMWGKMVPEMVRFLVKKPFGISAPLGGLLLAKDVWMNVQLQLQTDEDTRKWVDEHPEMLRFMSIMTPGTPFELPVNVPVFWRRATENLLTNASKGPEEQKVAFDSMKALSDTVQYAFGLGHFFDTVGAISEEGRDTLLGQPQPEEGGVTGTGGYTFSSLGQQGNTP